MPNHNLIQSGYQPANIIVLHDPGTIIKTSYLNEDTAWWKEYPLCGKSFTLDGECLEELANIFGMETRPLRCEGRNGRASYHTLSSMTVPIGNLEIEEKQDNCTVVEKLFAKIESGVLHLAAAFEGGEFVFSSHGGSFDISWTNNVDEVTGK